MVHEVRRLLLFALLEVDGDEFIGDVALFGDQGHDARVSGRGGSVKLERCHGWIAKKRCL
jgi:hypothetical protein